MIRNNLALYARDYKKLNGFCRIDSAAKALQLFNTTKESAVLPMLSLTLLVGMEGHVRKALEYLDEPRDQGISYNIIVNWPCWEGRKCIGVLNIRENVQLSRRRFHAVKRQVTGWCFNNSICFRGFLE